MKYSEEVKARCVQLLKEGKGVTEVSKTCGPNVKAVERYAKKAGVAIAKKPRAPKAAKVADPQ